MPDHITDVLVYAVFNIERGEGEALVGLFSSEEKAEARAAQLRGIAEKEWQTHCQRFTRSDPNDNPTKITVEVWKLDV